MSSVQPDEFGFSWIELEPTLAAPLNYVLEACFESCYGLMEIVNIRVVVELSVISIEVHPHPMFLNETLQIRCV